MIKRRQVMYVILAATVFFVALAGSGSADWGKTAIKLYCYAGDRSDNHYIGTVEVFDTVRPASKCNVMYNNCDGNCTACYIDEAGREICVDNSQVPRYY